VYADNTILSGLVKFTHSTNYQLIGYYLHKFNTKKTVTTRVERVVANVKAYNGTS